MCHLFSFCFLNSVSAVQKLGVLDLLDEESRFPKGTDTSLLDKLHGAHKVHM